MKTIPEKSGPLYWRTGLTACCLLLLAAGALYWLAVRGEYALMLYQLAVLLAYPAGILLLSSLFSILSTALSKPRKRKPGKKKEKKPAGKWPAVRLFLRKGEKDAGGEPETDASAQAPEETPAKPISAAEEAPAQQQEACDEGLRTIERRSAGKEKEKKRDLRKLILGVLYAVFQAALAAGFIYYSFSLAYPITAVYFLFTYLHAAIMLIAAGALLVAGKLMEPSSGSFNPTASDLLKICGALLLVSAVAVVLRVMFGLDSQRVFYWFYRIFGAVLVLDLALALLLAGIKGTLAEDYAYSLIPRRNGKGMGSFIFALEAHTGISLKSLWSIKYLGRIAPAAILGLLLLMFISTSVYVVSPQQQAAVYRFGSFDRDSVVGPGIHLKLPWPIDQVAYYDVQRTQSLQVGYSAAGAEDFFWTQAHDGEEYTLLLGSGTELVSVNMKLLYRIDDLYAYLCNMGSPEEVLTARAYEMLMNRTVTTTLDQLLTADRAGFAQEFTAELTQYCADMGLGLTVSETVIQSIHPPIQIADVYQEVINAALGKNTMIVNAHTAADKTRIEANKTAETAVLLAQTNQTKRIADAEYEMSVYYAAFEAWKADPESFLLHKYLTTYEKIIAGNKVYVFMPGTGNDLSRYVFGASGILGKNGDSVIVNDALADSVQEGSAVE